MLRLLRPNISHGAKPFRRHSSSGSGMEASAGTGMYPLHRCKTIYLVRHAQGIHNVEGDKDPNAYMSPALFDAQLTPLGWKQVILLELAAPLVNALFLELAAPLVCIKTQHDYVECLREHVKKCGLAERIELVISSPVLSLGVFGGENHTDSTSAPPLMVENAGHSEHPAVSSLNCPPFLAVEACRERSGLYLCDRRRSITEYQTLFPAIDFSLIESDEDALWVPDVRESKEAVAARAMKFIDWLWTREEKEIAIVSHGGFIFHTLNMYSKECHQTIREEMIKVFENCELRSMILYAWNIGIFQLELPWTDGRRP
ncbi:hypothetical protein ACP4OV_010354 [Aristida adscensionis]